MIHFERPSNWLQTGFEPPSNTCPRTPPITPRAFEGVRTPFALGLGGTPRPLGRNARADEKKNCRGRNVLKPNASRPTVEGARDRSILTPGLDLRDSQMPPRGSSPIVQYEADTPTRLIALGRVGSAEGPLSNAAAKHLIISMYCRRSYLIDNKVLASRWEPAVSSDVRFHASAANISTVARRAPRTPPFPFCISRSITYADGSIPLYDRCLWSSGSLPSTRDRA
jgi:hypothetical protein